MPNLRLSRFFSYLSSRSFIVLSFTLRSIIHFELISVKWIVSLSGLLSNCPVIPATFGKNIILVPLYFLCSFVKNQLIILYVYVGLFLGFILFHWSLCSISHCLDNCDITINFEVEWCQASNFILINIKLLILSFLPLHILLGISLLIPTKIPCWHFDLYCIECTIKLDKTDILTILNDHSHGYRKFF